MGILMCRVPWWPVRPFFYCGNISEILAIIGVIFSLIMLIDCLRRKPAEFLNPLTKDAQYDKLIWALGILLSFSLYFAGAIVYFFVVKRAKPEKKE